VAHRNWSRLDATWHPIDLLPAKMPPAILFANEDKSRQWLVHSPRGAENGQRKDHRRDDEGKLMFDQAGEPVIDSGVLIPAFFAFVALHETAT
jgi:hypothetical protein